MSSDTKARRARFEATWPAIRDEIMAYFTGENMPQIAVERYRTTLDYNVLGGKLNRGTSVCDTAEILKGSPLSDTEYKRAAVLGWCVELMQAFFLVGDDIMDNSITRRDQPCWYRVPGVGMMAINDSYMLEAPIYFLLKKYFKREPYYPSLLDLFHSTTYRTCMGELVDVLTAPEDSVNLDLFDLKRHRTIVIYKTAYYSFWLPVACAMMVHGIPYPEDDEEGDEVRFRIKASGALDDFPSPSANPYQIALAVLIRIGEHFQVQDDFLDWTAPPEVLGKIGSDIVDNKCSWVVNLALLLTAPSSSPSSPSPTDTTSDTANPATTFARTLTATWTAPTSLSPARKAELRQILDDNYGRKDPACEARVKQVYEELEIAKWYKAFDEAVVKDIRRVISEIDEERTGLRQEVFYSFLNKINGRSK